MGGEERPGGSKEEGTNSSAEGFRPKNGEAERVGNRLCAIRSAICWSRARRKREETMEGGRGDSGGERKRNGNGNGNANATKKRKGGE